MVCAIIAVGAFLALLAWVNELAIDLRLAVEDGKITPPSLGETRRDGAHVGTHVMHGLATPPPPRPMHGLARPPPPPPPDQASAAFSLDRKRSTWG